MYTFPELLAVVGIAVVVAGLDGKRAMLSCTEKSWQHCGTYKRRVMSPFLTSSRHAGSTLISPKTLDRPRALHFWPQLLFYSATPPRRRVQSNHPTLDPPFRLIHLGSPVFSATFKTYFDSEPTASSVPARLSVPRQVLRRSEHFNSPDPFSSLL